MPEKQENPLILFFKKSYLAFGVIAAAVIFFLGYNAFLVDHSLVNLKLAVDKISDARTLEDAKKIQSLVVYSLKREVSAEKININNVAELEFAQQILGDAKNMAQLRDAKLFLNDVIERKEKERGVLRSSLDTISKNVIPVERKETARALEKREDYLIKKISTTKDKDELGELYSQLDAVYVRLGDSAKAEAASLQAIKLDTRGYRAAKARFLRAWSYKQKGELQKAGEIFSQISEEYPDMDLAALSKYQAADILYAQGKVKEAIKSFEGFFDQYSFMTVGQLAQFRAGSIYLYDLNDREATAAAFNKLSEKWQRGAIVDYVNKKMFPLLSRRYRNKGYELLMRREFNAADMSFSQAIEINPKDSQSLTGKGLARLGLGNIRQALELTSKAVEITPDDWVCVANLGYVYTVMKKYEAAQKQYARAVVLNPRIAELYYNLGYTFAVRGNFKKAIILFKRAIAIKQGFSFAYNNLAYSLWYENNYSRAVEELNIAVGLNPDYLEAHYNLALIYEKLAAYGRAKEEFDIVARLNPGYRDIASRLKNLETKAAR